MKLRLTADQTKDLPFPIGCPVWYNAAVKQTKEPTQIKELTRGVIGSASFDCGTREMVYEVVCNNSEKDTIAEEASEHDLAYGASCPVIVSSSSDSDEDGLHNEGTILLSEPSLADPGKFTYTVMIMDGPGPQARFERGVNAERVKYRSVNRDLVCADKAETAAASSVTESKAFSINNAPSTAQPSTSSFASPGEVPSSITCDSVAKRSSAQKPTDVASSQKLQVDTEVSINNGARCMRSPTSHSRYSDSASCSRAVGVNEREKRHIVTMKTPAWIQRDVQTQRGLFFHLIGSKRHDMRGKRTVNDVQRETNCRINVHYERSPRNCNAPAAPITITMEAMADRDLDHAREKLLCLLVDYLHHVIHDYEATERLVYEVASSCEGAHRPRASSSHAVASGRSYMSIVELPKTAKSDYHRDFLLRLPDLAFGRRQGDIRVYGLNFQAPLKSCNPYVAVRGLSWKDVDMAVDVVKHNIGRHMRF